MPEVMDTGPLHLGAQAGLGCEPVEVCPTTWWTKAVPGSR